MSFNKYYQDELSFLREMGKEFAMSYPSAAQFLADRGSDPDVERLLEGFAFLTGRIRQKLDDEFPELTHALMSLLWPHYLRPVPSVSMIEFMPVSGSIRARQRIPSGTEVTSVPVEGTPCRFRTCFDLDLYPFTIENAEMRIIPDGRSSLRLRFIMNPGVTPSKAEAKKIRLHLFGEPAYTLYLWLCQHLAEVRIQAISKGNPGQDFSVSPSMVRPVGFSKEEALLPYPKTAFDGYRLLQEYFTYPEKFLFVELSGLDLLAQMVSGEAFEVNFIFSKPSAASLRITRENIRLYCTPIANLFFLESDPIRVSHERIEYRIRPACSNPLHYETYSIDQAMGWVRGTAEEHKYESFYSFNRGFGRSANDVTYYQARLRNAVIGDGTETYVSFVNAKQDTIIPPTETVVFRLTCTNRDLAGKLRVGDIQIPTENSPEFAQFRNITKVSPAIHPPIGGDLYWRLISHLSLNYISLLNIRAFRGILELYNFQSLSDRQAGRANERRIEGIQDIEGLGADLLFQGAPIRGNVTRIALMEDHFSDEGDFFLFATVLNEFLSLYSSINSFSQLIVRGVKQGEIYKWQPRIGHQIIL